MIRVTRITRPDDSYKDVFMVAGRVSNTRARRIVVYIDGERIGAADLTKSQDGGLEFHFLRQYLTKAGKRKCLLKVFDNRGRVIGEKSVFFYGTPIRCYIDKPVAGSVVNGIIDICGWIASLHPIKKYTIDIRGKTGVCLSRHVPSRLSWRRDLKHLRAPYCGGFDVRTNLVTSGSLNVTLMIEDAAGNRESKTIQITCKEAVSFDHCYMFLCR